MQTPKYGNLSRGFSMAEMCQHLLSEGYNDTLKQDVAMNLIRSTDCIPSGIQKADIPKATEILAAQHVRPNVWITAAGITFPNSHGHYLFYGKTEDSDKLHGMTDDQIDEAAATSTHESVVGGKRHANPESAGQWQSTASSYLKLLRNLMQGWTNTENPPLHLRRSDRVFHSVKPAKHNQYITFGGDAVPASIALFLMQSDNAVRTVATHRDQPVYLYARGLNGYTFMYMHRALPDINTPIIKFD